MSGDSSSYRSESMISLSANPVMNLVATASQANPLAAWIPWSSSASRLTNWPLSALYVYHFSHWLGGREQSSYSNAATNAG